MCRKGYYALNTMFICDAGMRILAVDPLRPGSDHDAHVWRTTWLRRRFLEGHIAKAGEHLLGDSGYPLEPWLLTPVTGHPPIHTAEGRYNTAHAAMRSVVERCIGLLKSCFRCLERYRALHYEPERAANIVAACAVLHNLCLDEGDVFLDDVSDDSSNSSSDDESGNPSPQRVPRVRAARMIDITALSVFAAMVTHDLHISSQDWLQLGSTTACEDVWAPPPNAAAVI
nr:putative nuclease HARBI1 [Dermacentor andersoni]